MATYNRQPPLEERPRVLPLVVSKKLVERTRIDFIAVKHERVHACT